MTCRATLAPSKCITCCRPLVRWLRPSRLEATSAKASTSGSEIMTLADLPSMEVLRGRLLGVFSAPATKLVTLLNTPASQMARVLKAQADKLSQPAPAPAAA